MPIYEYLCNSCGVKKEHIQKMSDTPIKICPACGSEDYVKLISAAGFQLKGSGWYVTDFKNKPSQPSTATAEKTDTSSQSSKNKTDTSPKTNTTSKQDTQSNTTVSTTTTE